MPNGSEWGRVWSRRSVAEQIAVNLNERMLLADRLDLKEIAMDLVYKIVPTEAWQAAVRDGVFKGYGIDLGDPFIHLSSTAQVKGTLDRFFKSVEGLSVVAIDVGLLGDALVWESSDDDVLFPHLYAPLALDAVREVVSIPVDAATGKHILPDTLA